MKKIAVIGAGLAGIGAARLLSQAGHDVTIFEKEAFVGGRTHTHRGEGFLLNTGAGFYTNFYPILQGLVEELGLEDGVIENAKCVTLATPAQQFDYQLDSVISFFRIPFLSFSDKLKLLRLTLALTLKKKQLSLVKPEQLALHDSASMADFARKKVGERAYHYLMRTAIEPYWYYSCEAGSAAKLKALQAHAAGARFFTLRAGMDSLAKAMSAGHNLRLSTPIEALALHAQGVQVQPENGAPLLFDAVVLATTAPAAQKLLTPLPQAAFPEVLRTFLHTQGYAANINGYFFVPKKLVEGMAPQIAPCGPETGGLSAIALHGAQVAENQHPELRLLGVWLNDAESRAWLNRPDNEVAQHLWQLTRQYCPNFPAEMPRLAHLTRRPEAIPVPEPGRYSTAVQAWQAQRPPIVLAGDFLSTATMEGALYSGQRAAQILMNAWKN